MLVIVRQNLVRTCQVGDSVAATDKWRIDGMRVIYKRDGAIIPLMNHRRVGSFDTWWTHESGGEKLRIKNRREAEWFFSSGGQPPRYICREATRRGLKARQ